MVSESILNLLSLLPQPAMIVDISTQKIIYHNDTAGQVFAMQPMHTTDEIAALMTHTASTQAVHTAMHKELQQNGKAILCHIGMKTKASPLEHYDVHITYLDAHKNAVYLIFARSAHELARMEEQNNYYNTISEAAYSYPFHLDVKARRMEFFDPKLEYLLSSLHNLSLVMENFPEPVLTSGLLCEDDTDAYLAVVDRMYKGEPPQGSFRCYDPKGELLRYSLNYVVNRDEFGNPIEITGDFIIQSETKIDTELPLAEKTTTQKVVLAHQIKAHFFFNTLNTISALCKQDAAKADNAIRTFATYMRSYMYLINEQELIPFVQELTLVKSTLEIEKLRFPNSFTYELDLQETDFDIPPLTLQPIVENALLHGLRRTGRHGTLKISTRKIGNLTRIIISDDGLGFDTAILEKTKSIGLKNITQRIELMLGGCVNIHSARGSGTTAVIEFPMRAAPMTEVS